MHSVYVQQHLMLEENYSGKEQFDLQYYVVCKVHVGMVH